INQIPADEDNHNSSRLASTREFYTSHHNSMRKGGVLMLLQRLREYAEMREDLPPAMYQAIPIRYVLRLDAQEEHSTLIDLATQEHKRGLEKLAPNCVRSSGDRPILFADHAEYTFGLPREQTEKGIADAGRRFRLYQTLVKECADMSSDPAAL